MRACEPPRELPLGPLIRPLGAMRASKRATPQPAYQTAVRKDEYLPLLIFFSLRSLSSPKKVDHHLELLRPNYCPSFLRTECMWLSSHTYLYLPCPTIPFSRLKPENNRTGTETYGGRERAWHVMVGGSLGGALIHNES